MWQQHRARSWESEHRTWQQRGGYNGYRIPQDRYRRYFGPQHRFRIYRYPMVVIGGYPRFQYGGFWFSLLDPWPEYWSDGWYDNDDVYIDYYEDGYYLYNPRYPQGSNRNHSSTCDNGKLEPNLFRRLHMNTGVSMQRCESDR